MGFPHFFFGLARWCPAAPPGFLQASRKELLQRAASAQSDLREERLRRCVEEAEQQNFVQALGAEINATMAQGYVLISLTFI